MCSSDLGTTNDTTDDSVIIIDDKPSSMDKDNDFISLSPIKRRPNRFAINKPTSPTKGGGGGRKGARHVERTKRFKDYLANRRRDLAKKVTGLKSNGLLEDMMETMTSTPKNMPGTFQSIASPQPSTSKVEIPQTTSQASTSKPETAAAASSLTKEKRIILIDGSNVAMSFTESNIGKKAMTDKDKDFSAEGK